MIINSKIAKTCPFSSFDDSSKLKNIDVVKLKISFNPVVYIVHNADVTCRGCSHLAQAKSS